MLMHLWNSHVPVGDNDVDLMQHRKHAQVLHQYWRYTIDGLAVVQAYSLLNLHLQTNKACLHHSK